MNNELFKKFLAPFVENAVRDIGGLDKVREMHTQMSMTSFISGWVCGTVIGVRCIHSWRDPSTVGEITSLTQEEIRRIFDFVRLRLESESTTS